MRWRCIGFYGAPQEQRWEVSWQLLHQLNDCSKVPSLVIGDFNVILFSFEKQGGLLQCER